MASLTLEYDVGTLSDDRISFCRSDNDDDVRHADNLRNIRMQSRSGLLFTALSTAAAMVAPQAIAHHGTVFNGALYFTDTMLEWEEG